MKPRIKFNRHTGKYECFPVFSGWIGSGETPELAYKRCIRKNCPIDYYHLAA